MTRVIPFIMLGAAAMVLPVQAQDANAPVQALPAETASEKTAQPKVPVSPPEDRIKLDAYDAVHAGNELLRSGAAEDALRHYEHAEKLQPDAREIAFAQGLGHYQLGEFEEARDAFQRAWLGEKDALADDALYSEGAAYHAEALAAMEEPEVALERLENAMQRYQSVLANQPDHVAAKDANYKAGAAWRQIKQQMQEQQQQKEDSQDDKEKNDDEQDQQEKQDQDKKNDEQQDQDQEQQDQNQQDQQDSDQKKDQDSENKEDAEKKPSDNEADPKQQERDQKQDQQQKQQQEVSQEQAERKLREMMQAQRQRKKDRKKHRVIAPVPAAEKDW